ncbi:MAG: DUF4190 domain-containing protein [Bacteroidetes bacterium]|nr:DUF4190 domain-containing protein [Bacteroidota bacterium]
MITYANGTKEVFKNENAATDNNSTKSNNHRSERSNDLAVLALVFGILGFVIGFGSIAAIVLGDKALKQIKTNPDVYEGEETAKIGKILGIVGIILKVLLFILIIFLLSTII